MKRWARWVVPLATLLIWSSVVHASQEEENISNQKSCPDSCTCARGNGERKFVSCYKMTNTQQFDESVTSFELLRSEDHLSPPFELPKHFFVERGLKNVESITITVDITAINPLAFEGLDSLIHVNLTDNKLKALHPDTFASNAQLEKLSLSKNPIVFSSMNESYNDDSLLNISNLNELDLSFCQLDNLTSNAFKNLPDLVYINLASNRLEVIDENTFQNITSLEELDLSDNNIRSLSPNSFLNIDNLFTLTMSNNPITSLKNVQVPGLSTLNLAFCNLNQLSFDSLSSFTDVTQLNLSGNGLTELNPYVFVHMTDLLDLDLSNNNLGPLDYELFSGNQLLETLSLMNNPLMRTWPEWGFKGNFKNLYYLDLSNTGIETFSPHAFQSMSYLTQLKIGRNSLKKLECEVLPIGITRFSLEENNITSLADLNIPVGFQVRSLFLAGNQFKFLNKSHFSTLDSLTRLDLSSCGLEKLWSSDEKNAPNLKNVRVLNLSDNKLKLISPDDLKVFSSLEMLDIRGNPLECNNSNELIKFFQDSSIKPIGYSQKGNIDEDLDSFLWKDIWKGCNSHEEEENNQDENYLNSALRQPSVSLTVHNFDGPIHEYESTSYEDNDDMYEEEDFQSKLSTHGFKSDEVSENGILHEQEIIEVQVLGSTPLLVFLTALGITLIVTLLLALLFTVCKKTVLRLSGNRRGRSRNSSLSYQHLNDNEHPNSPTTPIVKNKCAYLPHGTKACENV